MKRISASVVHLIYTTELDCCGFPWSGGMHKTFFKSTKNLKAFEIRVIVVFIISNHNLKGDVRLYIHLIGLVLLKLYYGFTYMLFYVYSNFLIPFLDLWKW